MEMKFPVIKNLQGKRRKEYMKGGHFVWYVEIHVYTLYMDIGVCTSFKLWKYFVPLKCLFLDDAFMVVITSGGHWFKFDVLEQEESIFRKFLFRAFK